jgi:hypothetical protein
MDKETLEIFSHREFYSLVHEGDEWLVFSNDDFREPVKGKTPEEALQRFKESLSRQE